MDGRKFTSETSIVPEVSRRVVSTCVSDNEIHAAPERGGIRTELSASVPHHLTAQASTGNFIADYVGSLGTTPVQLRSSIPPQGKLQEVSEGPDSGSDSGSLHSSPSFISAVSSQEDMTLVNLHMQVRCHNWQQSSLPLGCDAFTTPLFQRTEDGRLSYVGSKYLPRFETITEGFTSLKMISRAVDPLATPPPPSSKTPTHPYSWDSSAFLTSECDVEGVVGEDELLALHNENGTRTTIIVKSRGDIDIMCISRVEGANILKKEQSSYLSQMQTSKRGTAERGGAEAGNLQTLYEESIHTQTQGTIILPKVNFTLLQASIVEEIISFSALDNLRDLTCVSLFAICFDSVSAQFYSGRQAREVVQTFHRPAVAPSGSKKSKSKTQDGLSPTEIGGEAVHIETSEKQQEELILGLSVGKIHTQLRRLKNESSILKDAIITAISPHHSRVLFTCTRIPSPLRFEAHAPPLHHRKRQHLHQPLPELDIDDKLGFIMFECGLEGVSLKIVKKSHFEKGENIERAEEALCTESVKSREEFEEKAAPTESTDSSVPKEPTNPTKDIANTSSCVIEFKTVWFNFAAPPRAPITRKIDYTRLDWNLLSTASPGIDAWMNPSNRFAIRVVYMLRTMYRRSTGIVACLMAEALDIQSIHMPIKSRYGRVTPLAKTLQEDPSCQLCNVLLKYILQSELAGIEANLRESDLPMLSTLRQGVIVLSRQWKNVLYTPLLLEHNYKTKNMKPLNVTFAVQDTDDENILTDNENSGEDCEITDECTLLLKSPEKVSKSDTGDQPDTENFHSPTSPPPKKTLPSHPPCSSRASIVFPILNPSFSGRRFESNAAALRQESVQTLCSNPDALVDSSINSLDGNMTSPNKPWQPLEPEDLYWWMVNKQASGPTDFMKSAEERNHWKKNLESKVTTLTTEETANTLEGQQNNAYNLYPMSNSLHLLDAHLIFEPLLSCLGVMPEQISGSSFERWGSNLSLVGAMDTMRIDIVVSEFGKTDKKKKGKKANAGKFHLDIPPETPAFLCEKIGIEVDVKKMADMTVEDMIRKQNVLYISRGQLKKHTSTVLNFSLNIRYISQQVNMPLLRLLHQISNMYQNFKETQMELKEQQPEMKNLKVQKNDSSSTSEQAEQMDKIKPLHRTLSRTSMDKTIPRSASRGISPSASFRSRPQSFAQKLRSTGKSVKGYMNLSEGITTPLFGMSPSGSGVEHGTISSDKSKDIAVPKCWKTIYYLLDLYATMPETKTITHRFSMAVPVDISEGYKGSRGKYDLLPEPKDVDLERGLPDISVTSHATPRTTEHKPRELSVLPVGERTRLVVFGVARIHRTRLLASLSGLKLEAEITSLHSSVTCRRKTRPASLEVSITGQDGGEGDSGQIPGPVLQCDPAPQGQELWELRVSRTTSRFARATTIDEVDYAPPSFLAESRENLTSAQQQQQMHRKADTGLLQPLVMQFSVILQSLSITAALLPSLQSTGVTGSKAKFTIDLPQHSLSFTTKLQITETNLPPAASIELPKVHVTAEYVQDGTSTQDSQFADGMVLHQGSYLHAVAEIGVFEHSLTTDLLNHLVFVQKVFMKEVNEVLQKVYGGEKLAPLWLEDTEETSSMKRVLFSLIVRVKRIQLTATTPTNSAVRLETGAVEFQLSNRVQNVSSGDNNPSMKIFGKAQVEINLSLGQLIKNVIFEEAEPEFQQFAFFKTRISLRNAFQDETGNGEMADKEVVLITLRRPLIYIQPVAVDKAILVWLNYKNAYEYWDEQRSNLQKEVLTATQQVLEKVPFTQISAPSLGTLFLQLTVYDMGICLPLNPPPNFSVSRPYDESRGAVVVTLESTSISACSSGSLVSKGRFVGLCLRFAEDFETSLDEWRPDMSDNSIMNLCVVSEGTYEVCSRTTAQKQGP
ncbi:hypothetical protein B566_EDAN016814, partial [Ephemera danica]